MLQQPPPSPLFPYTTLFRSIRTNVKSDHRKTARLDSAVRKRSPGKSASFVLDGLHATVPRRETSIFPSNSITLMFVTTWADRKSTRLNSSHLGISYAVFCLK